MASIEQRTSQASQASQEQDEPVVGKLSLKRKNNFKVRARAAASVVASLRAQVKELEQQRDFLSQWKADMHTGTDVQGSLVDVEFQGSNGDRIHAHRAVLAAKSIQFEGLFRTDAEDKIVWELDMPYEAMKAFITFFYTGRVCPSVFGSHSITLLDAAEKYKVEFLTLVCEDTLVNNVTRDNVISTFEIAKKRCSSACKEAILYKATSFGELSTFTEYRPFSQSNPGLVLELYEQLVERKGQLAANKQKAAQEKVIEQLDGDIVQMAEGCTSKLEADGVESVDDEDGNPGFEQKIGASLQLDAVAPFGRPIYWHGPHMPGHPFPPVSFENTGPCHPYDVSMITRPPFSMPPFTPSAYPGGAMPMGFMGGAIPPLLGPPEKPVTEAVGKKRVWQGGEAKEENRPPKKQRREKQCVTRGVKFSKNKSRKFLAIITVKGQHFVLGTCQTEEEAGRLYDRAAYVVGRKTNNEIPDDVKEELRGIPWDDFVASLQEVKALEKIHQGKIVSVEVDNTDRKLEQEHVQGEEQEQEQDPVLTYASEHSTL